MMLFNKMNIKAVILLLSMLFCIPISAVTLHVSIENNTDRIMVWSNMYLMPGETKTTNLLIGQDVHAGDRISYVTSQIDCRVVCYVNSLQ